MDLERESAGMATAKNKDIKDIKGSEVLEGNLKMMTLQGQTLAHHKHSRTAGVPSAITRLPANK